VSDAHNRIEIKQVPLKVRSMGRPVTSLELSQVQKMLHLEAERDAPRFFRGEEPVRDDRAYKARDGKLYYRPQLRVAARAVGRSGPEVAFLKDADGGISLRLVLEERPPEGIPGNARPLDVRVEEMMLRWEPDGEWTFSEPLVMSNDRADEPGAPAFHIVAGSEVAQHRLDELYRALSDSGARARLHVELSYGYWVDGGAADPVRKPHKPDIDRHFSMRVKTPEALLRAVKGEPAFDVKKITEAIRSGDAVTTKPGIGKASVVQLPPISGVLNESAAAKLKDPDWPERTWTEHLDRLAEPDFFAGTVVRKLEFFFAPSLDANRPIYAALREEESLPAEWTDSPYGMICRSPFPNTVYRLPDGLRLAYDEELGIPHVIPVLYRDDDGEPRVRVTLRAVPWHDPQKLVQLRDWLQALSDGAYVHPHVVTGGYREASLSLGGMFPEGIQTVGDQVAEISLEGGIDLTLDVTAEFYRHLCEMLSALTGLTGEVAVAVEVEIAGGEDPPERLTRRIPMRLRFRELAGLPVQVHLDEGVLSPGEVRLQNRASTPVQVGGFYPRLLQVDSNSVVPLGAFPAATSTPFPLKIGADDETSVDLRPGEEVGGALWNAVAVELADPRLMQPPEETLDRVHRVLPRGSVRWVIEAECPVFMADSVPDGFADLHAVEVQIVRDGHSPLQMALGRGDEARAQVSLDVTLPDLLGEEAERLHQFSYRVRNIYLDRIGAWSEARETAGSRLFVVPNPVEEDER